jgi:hypothetical protein
VEFARAQFAQAPPRHRATTFKLLTGGK